MSENYDNRSPQPQPDLGGVFRATLNRIPYACSIISAHDYRYLFINQAQVDMMGCLGVSGAAAALGRRPWDVVSDLRSTLEPLCYEAAHAAEQRKAHGVRVCCAGRELSWDILIIPNVDEQSGTVDELIILFADVTRQLEKEASLRRRDELYRRVVESTSEGIWLLGADGQTEFVSTQMADMLGYGPEEMVGRSFLEFMDEKDRAEAQKMWEKRAEGEASLHDFRFGRKDGTYIWTLVSATPLFDEDGRFSGAFGIITDITERKLVEDALLRSERSLREAEELAHLGSYEFELPDGEVIWSQETFRITARDPEQGPPSVAEYMEMVHPEDRERLSEDIEKSIANRTRLDTEYRIVLPSGLVKHIHSVGQAQVNAAGEAVGFFGTILDITERKQVEEALRASEEQFHTLVALAPIGIYETDREGKCIYVNQRWSEMAGLTMEEALGEGWINGIHPDDREMVLSAWRRMVESHGHWGLEYRFVNRAGKETWVLGLADTLRNPSGEITGYIGTNLDVTEHKRTEEALKASEAKYHKLYDSLTDAFATTDMNGNLVEWNEAFIDMLGYEPDELSRLSYLDITPEKWHDYESRILEEQVFTRGYSDIYEKEYRRKDGTTFPVELRTIILRDDAGRPTGMWAIVRDITERVRARELAEALNQINKAISSTLDYDEILQRVVVIATEAFGTDAGFLVERSGDSWLIRYSHRFPADVSGKRLSDDEAGYTVMAARTKEPVVVRDTRAEGEPRSVASEAYGIRSQVVIPLLVRDTAIGALHFCDFHEPVAFSEAQIRFARELGVSVSLALENARLYGAERQARAEEARARHFVQRQFSLLQEALLPVRPQIGEGYNVAATYIPAAPGQQIGGDFYDIFRIEDGRIGILVGDVSGKDVEAASLAAATRSTVRAFAYEMGSAAQALEHTNALVCAQLATDEMFVTIFLALLDPSTGDLYYATAGHPPPAIHRADGRVEFLRLGSTPVGLADSVQYEETRTSLEPGDKLLVYTDGISEARRDLELFDQAGIERVLKEYGDCPADVLVEELVRAAKEWAKGVLSDDIAVVLIERQITSP